MERAFLATGQTFAEKALGKGRLLFFALPLELNDNLKAIGDVYRFALNQARTSPVYMTEVQDAGLLICPTQLEEATLYVLTSESSSAEPIAFRDAASGKSFVVKLDPGRAALLLVSRKGEALAEYNLSPSH